MREPLRTHEVWWDDGATIVATILALTIVSAGQELYFVSIEEDHEQEDIPTDDDDDDDSRASCQTESEASVDVDERNAQDQILHVRCICNCRKYSTTGNVAAATLSPSGVLPGFFVFHPPNCLPS